MRSHFSWDMREIQKHIYYFIYIRALSNSGIDKILSIIFSIENIYPFEINKLT